MIIRRMPRLARAIVPQLLALLAACTTPLGSTQLSLTPSATTAPAPMISPTVVPTATVLPSATATAEPVAQHLSGGGAVRSAAEVLPTAQPTAIATPTPRPYGTPPRIGVQVGHLNSDQLPEELARLRTSTGAYYNGIEEFTTNLAIAEVLKTILEARGMIVDLIPATVPPGYQADAFLAIHADGSAGQQRGWKLATPWRTSRASQELLDAVAANYGVITGIPQDRGGASVNMRGYYAFSYRRYIHAVAPTTPSIIVETGFLTSAADRAVIVNQPALVAQAIAAGVVDYLRLRDPRDGAGLVPPQFPAMRARDGALLRRAAQDTAVTVITVPAGTRIVVFQQQGDWYEGFARIDDATWIGWIRTDQVEVSNEPFVMPTAENANP